MKPQCKPAQKWFTGDAMSQKVNVVSENCIRNKIPSADKLNNLKARCMCVAFLLLFLHSRRSCFNLC